MANTLNATLTLASTDVSSDNLSMTVTDSLSVIAPSGGLSKINATATGGDNIIVPASTAIAYLFVRHTGTTNGTTATAQLVDVEETGDAAFARLGAGEFCFLPFCHHAGSVGVQLQVNHASVVQMEYAFFTKA